MHLLLPKSLFCSSVTVFAAAVVTATLVALVTDEVAAYFFPMILYTTVDKLVNFSALRYQTNLSSSRHVPPSPLRGDPRSGLLLRLPRVDAAGRGGGEVPGARRVQGEPIRHVRGRGKGAAGGGAPAGHHAALPGQLK